MLKTLRLLLTSMFLAASYNNFAISGVSSFDSFEFKID